jgi:undecaprenyl-diphosphatase
MNLIIKSIILGIIQGVTEFLPISSTGHLILANKYLEFTGEFANLFAVVIQAGSIVAIIIYFKDKLIPEFKHTEENKKYFSLWAKVVVGIIPAGILGTLFEQQIEDVLYYPTPVSIALIVGAILLILVENQDKAIKVDNEYNINYFQALIVGFFQCLALIPGMSRSASTIIGGLVIGFNRKVAAEFSFFLAIPTLLGASLIKLLKASFQITSYQWLVLLVGTVVSYLVSYLVIAKLMDYIKKHDFKIFAYYRILLGIIVLLLLR